MARGRKQPSSDDPIFRAEMDALATQRHAAFVGDFPERWTERMAREQGTVTISASRIHAHTDDCWTEPYTEQVHDHYLRVQRCRTTNTLREVKG